MKACVHVVVLEFVNIFCKNGVHNAIPILLIDGNALIFALQEWVFPFIYKLAVTTVYMYI